MPASQTHPHSHSSTCTHSHVFVLLFVDFFLWIVDWDRNNILWMVVLKEMVQEKGTEIEKNDAEEKIFNLLTQRYNIVV